jgi:hypothetical protein
MPVGRPPKSAAEKKRAGTARKDRRTTADAPPPPKAKTTACPPEVPKALAPKWAVIIADLEAVGIVSNTDLARLVRAFAHLAKAQKIEASYNDALAAGDTSAISKLQSAFASADNTFCKIVGDVERGVKLRPKEIKKDGTVF